MSQTDDSIQSARDRIRIAYDPELLRVAGQRLAAQLANHLTTVSASSGKVLNWAQPDENIQRAKAMADEWDATANTDDLATRFAALVKEMLSRGHNLHDPRYVGHQVPASVPLAGLFDAVGSVVNQVMAIYEMGPWSTAVEVAMVHKLASYLGWTPGSFAGLVTHGGSLANLNGLLVARNVALGDCWEAGLYSSSLTREGDAPPVLVAQSDAHYSVARSAGILGLGTRQVVKVALDERRRMDPQSLDATLSELKTKGHPIIAVVACACSTPIGAFDPLNAIADVCERHEVWLHVDAAHGGSALLSDRHRHLVAGLERADSLVWDAHKMMFVPALCAFLFFKNHRHSYEAFHQNAPYLFDPSAPGLAEYDIGLRTFECTKRSAAYGLWGLWSMFGPQLFADMVNVTFDLARVLYEKLEAADDFVPLHLPECNIVAFRHLPRELSAETPQRIGEFQRQLRRTVIESGEFYLVATNLNGVDALRVTLINPMTTPAHLDQLLDSLRRHGRRLLQRS